MSANGIAHLPTKEARQVAKLDLAQTKRQAVGTNGYRTLQYYDINLLPTKYVGNDVEDNASDLQPGRPWVADAPAPDLTGQPMGLTLILTNP